MDINSETLLWLIITTTVSGVALYFRQNTHSRNKTIEDQGNAITALRTRQEILAQQVEDLKQDAITGEDVRRIIKQENSTIHESMIQLQETMSAMQSTLQTALLKLAEQSGYNKAKHEDDR